ncbi:MAG: proton-conducting transporter membrane subunit [Nocardioides sp.]|uniref:proton-conducting transporter transmembrane domain-containing protein n=1 Tax=Nocardioides sp. TaxID=35761 RepID=UPI0039E27134
MILLLAFVAWALAALASVVPGPARRPAVAWLANAAGCALAVVGGARALTGHDVRVPLGPFEDLGQGLGSGGLELDRLGGLFVVIALGVALPACLTGLRGSSQASARLPRLPAAVAACLASVLFVLAANHLFWLLFGWEGLTLGFFLLTGFDRADPRAPSAALAAASFGKASGAAVLLGGLLAARSGGGLGYADLQQAHGHLAHLAFALLLVGFAVKIGAVPVQVWLPPAYATAPGPARAIMAGAAVNVGFYGMWRTLDLLGPAPAWLAIVVLIVAGVTAVLGIAHGAVHPDLRGLVAWSSVENAGVIGAGYGVALIGSHVGDRRLMAAGLLAATAQVIAHALGKSLLFVVVREVEETHRTADLDALRDVARSQPWTGAGLVVGALTLAGLPLTAGFASEWLTLESLMQQFRIDHLGMQLASAVAGALVALSIGVAGVTFVRLIALTGFGAASGVRRRHEALGLKVAVTLLVLGCLGAAAAAPWEIDLISAGVRPLVADAVDQAHASDWAIQPVFSGFSSLSPSWLWLVIPGYLVLLVVVVSCLSGRRPWRVRRVPAWSSASPGVDRGVGYTSFGYANPMRKVLANLLLTHHQIQEVSAAERRAAVRLAGDRGASVDRSAESVSGTNLAYEVDVVEIVGRYLYRPAYAVLQAAARIATRLQSGRLDAYMAYMLLVLLAVVALVAAVS